MQKSHYIDRLPEAEYEVLDAAGVDMLQPSGELSGFYSTIIDLVTAGNRGKAFTWALNGSGLSTNPAALDAAYEQNEDAVDAYLEHVDIDKIIQMITDESEKQKRFSMAWFRKQSPPFLAGAAIGAVAIAIFNNK